MTHAPGPFEQLLGIAVRLDDPDPEDTRDALKDLSTWMWWYCQGEDGPKEGYNPIVADAAPALLAACEAFVRAWEKSLQLEKTDVALRMAKAAIAAALI